MSKKAPQLIDFDWKVLVSLASNEVEKLKEPVVRLKLTFSGEDTANFELNKQELDDLVNDLQACLI